MENQLDYLIGLHAVGLCAFMFYAIRFHSLGKEVNKNLATGAQAIADLKQLMTDLATTVGDAVQEFSDVLTKIQQANNVDPLQVETLTQDGRTLVNTLQKAVADIKAALATPTPAPPAQSGRPVALTEK